MTTAAARSSRLISAACRRRAATNSSGIHGLRGARRGTTFDRERALAEHLVVAHAKYQGGQVEQVRGDAGGAGGGGAAPAAPEGRQWWMHRRPHGSQQASKPLVTRGLALRSQRS
jgi:hypothetical protein